ncbi:delta(14)-sterol reductase TM7SF2-like [Harmonia axyridis]|uniref:delta(14)-sterol reductase TM7SF2-like n=1 Tax=Harmonia axyridis TaxID=115357 RepID=UPI001E27627E|nr:delta(14)-sterol reductase TM7SF2-like [Harmonia axyridis]XP_045469210.1 delta(14)-sterol reductase TM7SF2-like [Harmonia axyridis]
MVREANKISASKSTEIRNKSPARTKSPSRKASVQKSPESKTQQTTKRTRERSLGRKTPERTKSPSRVVKDKSPIKSTTVEKSPTKPKRTKSPGRPKSPSRVSPSRAVSGDAKVIIKKVSTQIKKNDLELSGSDDDLPKPKPRATVKGRSRKFELEEIIQPNSKYTVRYETFNSVSNQVRRLTRSSQSQERVVHLKHFDSLPKTLGEFSDDEIVLSEKEPIKKHKTSIKQILGLIFNIFFTPAFVLSIYLLCNESTCTSLPDWKKFLSFSYFFDLQSFLGYSAVAVLVAVLSALPFGGRKVCNLPSKQPKFTYVMNGLFISILIVGSFITLEYFGYKVSTFIVKNLFHLVVSSILFGTLFSIYLYVRSFHAPVSALNPTQIDSSSLSGFFYGREVNPRLGNVLDFKIYLLRLYSITMILVDGAILVEGLELNTKLGPAVRNLDWQPLLAHPTLLVIVALHLIYFIGHIVCEARVLSSYFMQYESPGYSAIIGVLLYPFQLIIQAKYILDHKVNYATWELVALSLVYLVGYVIFTVSNNQKNSFRRNPYSSLSAKFESIPTSQGKKILCSGCWGIVRQPNLLGDILIHLAFLRFGVSAFPVLGVLATIYMLVERAVVLQADCKSKYGASWDKYCQKVKYVLVPKVY